jgi:hypothetical protein
MKFGMDLSAKSALCQGSDACSVGEYDTCFEVSVLNLPSLRNSWTLPSIYRNRWLLARTLKPDELWRADQFNRWALRPQCQHGKSDSDLQGLRYGLYYLLEA